MPLHRVRRRQDLDSIARQFRLRREDIGWAPENQALRERRELQQRLLDLRLLAAQAAANPDARTLAAVRTFQRMHGLPATGELDPATITALRAGHAG